MGGVGLKYYEKNNNIREARESLHKININEVNVQSVEFDLGHGFSYSTVYGRGTDVNINITGEVINKSNSRLDEIGLIVSIKQCISGDNCLDVADKYVSIQVFTPAGKIRTFEKKALFSNIPLNDLYVEYKVDYVCSGLCPLQYWVRGISTSDETKIW